MDAHFLINAYSSAKENGSASQELAALRSFFEANPSKLDEKIKSSNTTPLHRAVLMLDHILVETFLELGASPDITPNQPMSLVAAAASAAGVQIFDSTDPDWVSQIPERLERVLSVLFDHGVRCHPEAQKEQIQRLMDLELFSPDHHQLAQTRVDPLFQIFKMFTVGLVQTYRYIDHENISGYEKELMAPKKAALGVFSVLTDLGADPLQSQKLIEDFMAATPFSSVTLASNVWGEVLSLASARDLDAELENIGAAPSQRLSGKKKL